MRRLIGVVTVVRRVTVTAVILLVEVAGGGRLLDRGNIRRLHVLQRDPFLRCNIDGVTPWKVLDRPGTRLGIGFGGTDDTTVLRDLRRTADASRVTAGLWDCAANAGWSLRHHTTGTAGFWGRKTFEDRWTALLRVYVGESEQQPAVQIFITTAPVEHPWLARLAR